MALRDLVEDVPGFILAGTIWAYWVGAGRMIVWVRRRSRRPVGLVPKVARERAMWIVWVPLTIAWNVLPALALVQHHAFLAVPRHFRADPVLSGLRWAASAAGLFCLLGTIRCWRCMGKNWRMGVMPDQRTALVTTGPYARVRHPIYALSVLLMLSSVVVVPTLPMMGVAALHVGLTVMKARNEERFLLESHGEVYAAYRRRTGGFFPRLGSPDP